MQQYPENSNTLGNRLASYVAAERKKVAIATCLIAIMGFMWVRLLTGKGEPAAASAATVGAALVQGDGKTPEVSIVYVQPPFIEGRNDTLTVDCFSPGDWGAFLSKDDTERPEYVGSQSPDRKVRDQAIRRIAESLRVQIMEIGTEPQAFVSDTLVKEGGTLDIATGDGDVTFKVLHIATQMVVLECEDMTFEIKLKDK
jgi:hypothetical protein